MKARRRGMGIDGRLAERHALKKDYIPELSEIRMVRRAPDAPFALMGEDAAYIESCLREIEAAFGFEAFPATPFGRISGRVLIENLIGWWRTLEPVDARQKDAHARLPAAIRLLDTVSSLMQERAARRVRHDRQTPGGEGR